MQNTKFFRVANPSILMQWDLIPDVFVVKWSQHYRGTAIISDHESKEFVLESEAEFFASVLRSRAEVISVTITIEADKPRGILEQVVKHEIDEIEVESELGKCLFQRFEPAMESSGPIPCT
jgi:hypothetical protein